MKILIIITIPVFILSCKKQDHKDEVIDYYNKNQKDFELLICEFEKYQSKEDNKGQVRRIFSISGTNDKTVQYYMGKFNLPFIYLERSILCDPKHYFSEVKLELDQKYSESDYYLEYYYCGEYNTSFKSKNYESIRLNNHWALIIEN